MINHFKIFLGLLLGVLSGYMAGTSYWGSKWSFIGLYNSYTSLIVVGPKGRVIRLNPNIFLEFNDNGQYEARVTLVDGAGFTEHGTYTYHQGVLNFVANQHKAILSGEQPSFIEQLAVSRGTFLGGSNIKVIPLDEKHFILKRPYAKLYFCSQGVCG